MLLLYIPGSKFNETESTHLGAAIERCRNKKQFLKKPALIVTEKVLMR